MLFWVLLVFGIFEVFGSLIYPIVHPNSFNGKNSQKLLGVLISLSVAATFVFSAFMGGTFAIVMGIIGAIVTLSNAFVHASNDKFVNTLFSFVEAVLFTVAVVLVFF